jgi:hypothetical protein
MYLFTHKQEVQGKFLQTRKNRDKKILAILKSCLCMMMVNTRTLWSFFALTRVVSQL